MPASILVPPAYVLTPVKVKLPAPSLTNWPDPLITSLTLLLLSTLVVSIVALLPVKLIVRLTSTLSVKAKVASLSINTSILNLPALLPKLASLLIAKVPS